MPPAAISRLLGGFFGVFIDWPLIQSICLEKLLILRSKAVGICAETIEKVKTEARNEKKMKVGLGVEHQVSRKFVIF